MILTSRWRSGVSETSAAGIVFIVEYEAIVLLCLRRGVLAPRARRLAGSRGPEGGASSVSSEHCNASKQFYSTRAVRAALRKLQGPDERRLGHRAYDLSV